MMPSAAAIKLVDLNQDIILNIVYFLAVEEFIALLGTCRTLRELGKRRIGWIYALERTRITRPIPLPHNTDLSGESEKSLHQAAYHARRLGYNWNRPHPKAVGQIERVPFDSVPDTQIVSLIPGANIVVVFSAPNLVCYSSSARRKSVPLEIGEYCWRISRAYFERPGQFLVTVAAGDDRLSPPDTLVLIEITYTTNEVPSMKIRHTAELTPNFFDAFVFDDVVGYIWVGSDRRYYVSAWNYYTLEEEKFPTGLLVSGQSILACYVDHGHLFLIREDRAGIETLRYHRSMLPYGQESRPQSRARHCHNSTWSVPEPFHSIGLSPGFSNSYGVVAVSARSVVDKPDYAHAYFYVINSPPDALCGDLQEAPPVRLAARVQCVMGTEEALTSVRPTCAVYVLDHRGDEVHLQIVRYLGLEKNKVDTQHIVVIPQHAGIVSSDITSITSDDYMGVVYLTLRTGELIVIPFA